MIKLQRPNCPFPKALGDRNYKHPINKSALAEATHHKCMYCESKIGHVNFGHVEHIKPKAANFFPELEFEWGNLGYVCDRCNVAKGSKYFPGVEFIDPFSEDPSDELMPYGSLVFGREGSERGEITVNELKLNRPELVERRSARIVAIQRAYVAAVRAGNVAVRDSALKELNKEGDSDSEFSFVVGEFLKRLQA
jgi:Fe-S cluster biosynthesis and repair protein YggX